MISKNTLKNLEFKDKDEYFNYVVESLINGNFSQVKDLIKKMDKENKKEFLSYLDVFGINKEEYLIYLI